MNAESLTLKRIAALAHSGGLAGLTEAETLMAIRRLTLLHWDSSAHPNQMTCAVADALDEANLRDAIRKATTPP